MPKRRNPFGEYSPMQLKTHVGTKEFNMSSCGEQNLKDVYERTRQLLFNAAQKNNAMVTDMNDNHVITPMDSPPQIYLTPPQPESGQLTLDSGGHLSGPVAMESTMSDAAVASKTSKEKSLNCTFCKKTSAKVKCNFCEKLSCRNCVQLCSACNGEFCQLCSTINYDEAMERIFCLNCEC
ncbi:hypothetical protein KUTeg_012911 [Tegillarca granosa]|uniref:Apoptosis regulatory protein Siva n=1 Tax=Tegillarca granosa TaxID=220873 RepID=A0ABQ9EWQ9_TEGGR|nr:hypothetical protein KUTeg_012911 [Tegillarca granosa]